MGNPLSVAGGRVASLALCSRFRGNVELALIDAEIGEVCHRHAAQVCAQLVTVLEVGHQLSDESRATRRDVSDACGIALKLLALEIEPDLLSSPGAEGDGGDVVGHPVQHLHQGRAHPRFCRVIDGLHGQHRQKARAILGLSDQRLEEGHQSDRVTVVQTVDVENDGELARDSRGDLDEADEGVVLRQVDLDLAILCRLCLPQAVDEGLIPALDALGLTGQLRVQRHLDLPSEALAPIHGLEERSVGPKDDGHTLVFLAHVHAPEQDIVLGIGDGRPAEFADDGALSTAQRGSQVDRLALAAENRCPGSLEGVEVGLSGHVGCGGGVSHGALHSQRVF